VSLSGLSLVVIFPDWRTIRRNDGNWKHLSRAYIRNDYLKLEGILAPLLIS
jgi:hypothetical protein